MISNREISTFTKVTTLFGKINHKSTTPNRHFKTSQCPVSINSFIGIYSYGKICKSSINFDFCNKFKIFSTFWIPLSCRDFFVLVCKVICWGESITIKDNHIKTRYFISDSIIVYCVFGLLGIFFSCCGAGLRDITVDDIGWVYLCVLNLGFCVCVCCIISRNIFIFSSNKESQFNHHRSSIFIGIVDSLLYGTLSVLCPQCIKGDPLICAFFLYKLIRLSPSS